jgi:hypothetical protein
LPRIAPLGDARGHHPTYRRFARAARLWRSSRRVSPKLAARGGVVMMAGEVGLLPLVLRTAAEPCDVPEAAVMVHLRERAGLSSIFGL